MYSHDVFQARAYLLIGYLIVIAYGINGGVGQCDEQSKPNGISKNEHAINVAAYGSNILLVLPEANRGRSAATTLTIEDVAAIVKRCPAVSAAAPDIGISGKVEFEGRSWRVPKLIGTTRAYLVVRDWTQLKEGTAFSEEDIRDGKPVCLLGQTVVENLFKGASPLGRQIIARGHPFKVLGVLAKKGTNAMGVDQDDVILVPWQFVGKKDEAAATWAIWAKAVSTEKMPVAMKEIAAVLRDRRHITQLKVDDFYFRDITQSMGGFMGLANAFDGTTTSARPPQLGVAIFVGDETIEVRRFVDRIAKPKAAPYRPSSGKTDNRESSIATREVSEGEVAVESQVMRVDARRVIARRIDGRSVTHDTLINELATLQPIIIVGEREQVDPLFSRALKPETLVLLLRLSIER
jgi:hypothetical protein